MMTKDVDLLVYEPALFKLWKIDHQQRGKGGSGSLNGTAFTAAGVNFITAQIRHGDVLYLASIDGLIDGCCEIVEVVSASQLTVSILRADESDPPIPVGSGSNLIWRISTFAPQRAMAERELLERLELADETFANLTEASLRRMNAVAVAAALILVFESLICEYDNEKLLGRKKDVYRHMLDTALSRLRIEVDTSGDDQPDTTRRGDAARLDRR